MEPKVTNKEEILVVGIATTTNNEKELSNTGEISKLWSRFYTEEIFHVIINQAAPTEVLGVYTQYTTGASGDYLMLIGQQVSNTNQTDDKLVQIKIPASKYLVFTSKQGPVAQVVPETWNMIWQWFEEHDSKRAFTGDFELYDERGKNPEQAIVDIYISIK
ncbi:GyrI-like domain-containing protein [Baia soyae]|uniref:Putative transcriptional regulator YdeE n=1 Tax=Baia soyae TaxID=1544746 RepID=A0A4V2SX20_9BACL|nr:GyrI-like domain-containing protein [Baia soyae]TCP64576.1 putative transcriptional regulator YdeE [Baia soyae]